MAKGEFESPSKAATEAYRHEWDRIFLGAKAPYADLGGNAPKLDPAFEPELVDGRRDDDCVSVGPDAGPVPQADKYSTGCLACYPSGAPILSEGAD